MVTDDERRRVAKELSGRRFIYRIGCTLAKMLGTKPESCNGLRNPDNCEQCGKATCSRLADLIEPSCDRSGDAANEQAKNSRTA